MFLNIFSVTLSEDFIAYFCFISLIRFGKSVVRSLVFSLAVSAFFLRYEKKFFRCSFFLSAAPPSRKNGKKADVFGHFRVHENGQRTFFRPANRAEKTAAQPRRNLSVSLRNVITETVFQYRNPVRDSLPFRISVSIPDIRYTQPVLRTETAFQVRL